jgi:hypothetical protein
MLFDWQALQAQLFVLNLLMTRLPGQGTSSARVLCKTSRDRQHAETPHPCTCVPGFVSKCQRDSFEIAVVDDRKRRAYPVSILGLAMQGRAELS